MDVDKEEEFIGAVGGGQSFTKPQTKEWWTALFPEIQKKVGVCPLCKQNHTYKRKFDWGTIDWPSSLLKSCTKYQALTPVQEEGG